LPLSQAAETRQLAQDFNQMAETLEQLEGERKAMIADIAHELRNPLATLQFRLDALEDGVVSFNQGELRLLKDQLAFLSRLVEDLRTLSLADAGRLKLDLHPTNLSDLLTMTVELYDDMAKDKGVRLEYLSEPNLWVKGDPDRLRQVFSNLLDNALRVTSAGAIHVVLSATPEEVRVRLRDSGPGIPEDELGSIFKRFVQGKRRDTQGKDGSGLGLAIVQTLVGLHAGRVTASNHEGGAQFDVTLPRYTQEELS
jgi:signal transduction histidine kinase